LSASHSSVELAPVESAGWDELYLTLNSNLLAASELEKRAADIFLEPLSLTASTAEFLLRWCAWTISADAGYIEEIFGKVTIVNANEALKLHGPTSLFSLFLSSWLDMSRRKKFSAAVGHEDVKDVLYGSQSAIKSEFAALHTFAHAIAEQTRLRYYGARVYHSATPRIKMTLYLTTVELYENGARATELFSAAYSSGVRNSAGFNTCCTTKVVFVEEYWPNSTSGEAVDSMKLTAIPEDSQVVDGHETLIEGQYDIGVQSRRSSGSFRRFQDFATRIKRHSSFSLSSRQTGKSSNMSLKSMESQWRFSRVTGYSSNLSDRDSVSIRDSMVEDAMDLS